MPRKSMVSRSTTMFLRELSVGAVMKIFPQKAVAMSLDTTGTNTVRRRLLPRFVVFYLVILMAFYSEVSVRENLRILLESLRRKFGMGTVKIAVDSAISKARRKLGAAPFAHLFEAFAKPMGSPEVKGCFWKDLRLVAVDGTSVELQNTESNRLRFGIHRNQHGDVGYPQLKLVMLSECGTRMPFGLSYGRSNDYEGKLFDSLIGKLDSKMLLLADRHYYTFLRWNECIKTGCQLLWRIKTGLNITPVKTLDDGSYLAEIKPSDKLVRAGMASAGDILTVRVIDYKVQFEDSSEGEPIRLFTTLFDAANAPAEELARLYAERWSIESGFDEIKTDLRGKDRILRSQLPELVEQELYGFFLAYIVVRTVMLDAARKADIAPVELSFVHAVRVIKRKLAFFPLTSR